MEFIHLLTKPLTDWTMLDLLAFLSVAVIFYMVASFVVSKLRRL